MNSAKIELLDIFSYSCMNCLRSLEYIGRLGGKYSKYGLKIIMVHVPEWEFEKNASNIQNAIRKYKIKFPKIIDKNRKLLKMMGVNFWPTQILIKDGKEIYRHTGEGNYRLLEHKIRKELKINKKELLFKTEPKYSKYPTVYAGSRKKGKVAELKNKETVNFGIIYAKGAFLQRKEYLESIGRGLIKIKTKGKMTNIVAGHLVKKSITIQIHYNYAKNKKPNKKAIRINAPRLYNLIKSKSNNHKVLEIETDKGLAVYSFSFQ